MNHRRTFIGMVGVLAAAFALAGMSHADDASLFSVNFFGYGHSNYWTSETQPTVRMDGVKEGGIWETTAWQDIGPATEFPGPGTARTDTPPTPKVHTITADDTTSTATLTITRNRNVQPYVWNPGGGTHSRDPDTWDDGNASMLEGSCLGTYTSTTDDRRTMFEISNIPFAAYDIILYFSHPVANFGSKLANLRINDQIHSDPEILTGGIQFTVTHDPSGTDNVEPHGGFREITGDGGVGNYIVLTGLSGDFTAEFWGQGNNQIGISGFQILDLEVPESGPTDPDVSTVEADPSAVLANGVATSTVTVTLRDENGIPVFDKDVTLANTSGPQQATIVPSATQTTDTFGMAIFTVSSTTVGTEVFTATNVTDDIVVTQTASVEFFAARNFFSVNLWAPGRNWADEWAQESWRNTIRVNGKTAGVWETDSWDDIDVSTMGNNATRTITSELGATATFKMVRKRNQSPYHWTTLRDGTTATDPYADPEYMANGNASLLDAKLLATEDSDLIGEIEVSGLNLALYDVVIYLSMNQAQFGGGGNAGRGYIDFNETGVTEWFIPSGQPPTTLTQIVNSGDTGNYILYKDVTGESFTVEFYGHGFNHGGIAGFQIQEVIPPPRGTLITIF